MVPVDRKGIFRAEIVEYGLKEMDSGSIAVSLRCKLTDWWDGEKFEPWEQYDMEASGDVWVVKKDGNANQNAAESLMRHAGWDASFSSIVNGTWQPTACQISVEEETYKNKVQRKIGFINAWDRIPGAMSNVDADGAKALEQRFGASMRALFGNVSRNQAAPASKPNAPPPPSAPAPMAPAMAGAPDDDIPF
jgi:hypothetical protein